MIKKFKHQGVTWVDVYNPSKEEVLDLAQEYNLHPLLATELSSPSLRSKVDVYEDYIYLILHFPLCELCVGVDPNQQTIGSNKEIDFIIGKKFLITTHYAPEPILDEFAQILDLKTHHYPTRGSLHAGHLFFTIAKQFYQAMESDLMFINQSLRKAEANIFSGKEKETVKTLSNINRSLLDFRWSLKAHSDVLLSFQVAGKDFFGDSFHYYLRAVTGEYEKIWNMLESSHETFNDLRSTNESLLSIKTNSTMKTLTVLAFITLPLTLVGQIFGMSLKFIPLADHPRGFWIVLVTMAIIATIMVTIVRSKKWL